MHTVQEKLLKKNNKKNNYSITIIVMFMHTLQEILLKTNRYQKILGFKDH